MPSRSDGHAAPFGKTAPSTAEGRGALWASLPYPKMTCLFWANQSRKYEGYHVPASNAGNRKASDSASRTWAGRNGFGTISTGHSGVPWSAVKSPG